ncbi:MAG: leucine-rich repeat domain-containing protein [Prevotella sp.]|nr:leucine-rich repeat domain-containing protein [Prevotella sp.]
MKAKRLISLLVLMLNITGAVWAARTAPTLPAAQTLQSGRTYYLYNIDSQLFLHRYYTNYVNLDANGSAVTFTSRNDKGTGAYTIQFADNYYLHLYGYNKDVGINEDNNSYQIVTGSSSAYKIQKSSHASDYYADHYFGHDVTDSDASSLYSNLTSGNITWKLINVDDAELYIARLALYNALNVADGMNLISTPYETIYQNSNDVASIRTATDEVNRAISMSQSLSKPSWSDYDITVTSEGNNTWNVSGGISTKSRDNADDNIYTLTMRVQTTEPATFVFSCGGEKDGSAVVMVDGVQTQTINQYMLDRDWNGRYFEYLSTPGLHTIKLIYTAFSGGTYYNSLSLYNIGVENTPTLAVTLPEPGSLGTEVRHTYDNMSDVRKLKINGEMNDDDWSTLLSMPSLFSLDLRDAVITTIPQSALSKDDHHAHFDFLHEVLLPNMVQTISNRAFRGTVLDNFTMPTAIKTIGNEAFALSRVRNITLPTTMTSIGSSAFERVTSLETINFPTNLTSIPSSCFYECYSLLSFVFSPNVTTVCGNAFYKCASLDATIPLTISTFEEGAFSNSGIRQMEFAENAKIGRSIFSGCARLESIVFPTTFSTVTYPNNDYVVNNCEKLTDVYFRSATVVNGDYVWSILTDNDKTHVTLHVPNYLVSAYMAHTHWQTCSNIVGFSTASIPEFVITQPLRLGVNSRFDGTPSLIFKEDATFEIKGDNSQTINNFYTETKFDGYEDIDKSTLVMSTCNNVNIQGDYIYGYYLYDNRWYFLTLPFDTKVSDLQLVEGGSYAIRYYDGAERATRLATGYSWKNYAANDIIPAGTGFIIQVSKRGYVNFKAQNNATKQYALKEMEFVKPMAKNACESNAHKGWNLVGNPFQCYYNLHRLGFTAPITVWEGYHYVAYSPIDDDYAILPNEAFFVQCPDDLDDLTFPINGKQMTDEIEQENAARALFPADNARKLMNIELSNGENTDKTRLVINPNASLDYELNRDAGKFLSNGVPQLYTLDTEGCEYAINERPVADGKAILGMTIPADGVYTISMSRSDMSKVMLTDLLTNMTINIAEQEYQFNAIAGKLNSRFVITFEDGNAATGINGIETKTTESEVWYSIDGRKVSGNSVKKGIYIKDGKKVVVK